MNHSWDTVQLCFEPYTCFLNVGFWPMTENKCHRHNFQWFVFLIKLTEKVRFFQQFYLEDKVWVFVLAVVWITDADDGSVVTLFERKWAVLLPLHLLHVTESFKWPVHCKVQRLLLLLGKCLWQNRIIGNFDFFVNWRYITDFWLYLNTSFRS